MGYANPGHRYPQRAIYEFAARHVPAYRNPRIEQIFMSSDIEHRYLAFDMDTLRPDESADDLHRRFALHSTAAGADAARRCLADAGCTPADVDCLVVVSCTGYVCPGLTALLARELGMRDDVQRADLVGMGCAGALPGLQRASDYAIANPGRRALVVTVEICSACYYVDDTLETVVGNAICGDGAAAVLVSAEERPGRPAIRRFETLLEPAYIHTVGFQFREGKLRIVLSKDIRDVAGSLAERVITRMLNREGRTKQEIAHWVIHSGGRKVIDSVRDAVGLTEEQLRRSRRVLKEYGNMSSPTVLFVLQDTQESSAPAAGDLGVMLAMGPGLAVEGCLLEW
jgi:predicted naringenin-chalcone synthase